MLKKIENGLVAVLYSPGYGAGWYTWHSVPELLFDPKVVDMVESNTTSETIELYCKEVYGDDCYLGARDLKVAWLPQGTEFMIQEFDGDETIITKREVDWISA